MLYKATQSMISRGACIKTVFPFLRPMKIWCLPWDHISDLTSHEDMVPDYGPYLPRVPWRYLGCLQTVPPFSCPIEVWRLPTDCVSLRTTHQNTAFRHAPLQCSIVLAMPRHHNWYQRRQVHEKRKSRLHTRQWRGIHLSKKRISKNWVPKDSFFF